MLSPSSTVHSVINGFNSSSISSSISVPSGINPISFAIKYSFLFLPTYTNFPSSILSIFAYLLGILVIISCTDGSLFLSAFKVSGSLSLYFIFALYISNSSFIVAISCLNTASFALLNVLFLFIVNIIVTTSIIITIIVIISTIRDIPFFEVNFAKFNFWHIFFMYIFLSFVKHTFYYKLFFIINQFLHQYKLS